MEISIYKHWLINGSVYETGIALYDEYGTNSTLKKLFAAGKSYYTEKKLDQELSKLEIPFYKKQPAEVKTSFSKKKIIVENLPDNLKAEQEQLGPIIREIALLNARLDLVASDKERAVLAFRIVDLVHQRRGIYYCLDYFQANGKQMPNALVNVTEQIEPVANELEILRLKNQRKLIASQISKAIGKPNKQAKLNDLIATRDEIDKQLIALK